MKEKINRDKALRCIQAFVELKRAETGEDFTAIAVSIPVYMALREDPGAIGTHDTLQRFLTSKDFVGSRVVEIKNSKGQAHYYDLPNSCFEEEDEREVTTPNERLEKMIVALGRDLRAELDHHHMRLCTLETWLAGKRDAKGV